MPRGSITMTGKVFREDGSPPPRRHIETWWFTDNEITDPESCSRDDLFYVICQGEHGTVKVKVRRDGRVTRRTVDNEGIASGTHYNATCCVEAHAPLYKLDEYGDEDGENEIADNVRRVVVNRHGNWEAWAQ